MPVRGPEGPGRGTQGPFTATLNVGESTPEVTRKMTLTLVLEGQYRRADGRLVSVLVGSSALFLVLSWSSPVRSALSCGTVPEESVSVALVSRASDERWREMGARSAWIMPRR